jgi:Fe-S cluster biosynthesis and repair protein YggX
MDDLIIPHNEKNSIAEVAVSIQFDSSLSSEERESIISSAKGTFDEVSDKFSFGFQAKFENENKFSDFSNNPYKIIGLQAKKNLNDKLLEQFSFENLPNNKTRFVFNALTYTKWIQYKDKLKNVLAYWNQFNQRMISNISLTFIDSFTFGNYEDGKNVFFNQDSKIVSEYIKENKNSIFSVTLNEKKGNESLIDQIEIRNHYNSDNLLIINSNSIDFENPSDHKVLEEKLNKLHMKNKLHLKEIISQEVQEKIGLIND